MGGQEKHVDTCDKLHLVQNTKTNNQTKQFMICFPGSFQYCQTDIPTMTCDNRQRLAALSNVDHTQFVLVCSSLWQFVLVCSSLFQFVLVCTSLYQFVLACSSLYQFVLVCTSLFQFVLVCSSLYQFVVVCTSLFQFVLVCTSLYQFVLVCTSKLQQDCRTRTQADQSMLK